MTPRPPVCAGAHAFLDAVDEIGPAGANVGAEHIGAVAFVVHAAGDLASGDPAAWRRRRRDRRWCRRSAAGRPADRAGSPVPGTCRRSARTGRGADSFSLVPNRSAMPGRYHTGSMATLITETLPFGLHDVAIVEPPGRDAAWTSGRSRRALVTAMLGRMSMPSAISAAEGLGDQMAPRIERDDALRAPSIAETARLRRRAGCW